MPLRRISITPIVAIVALCTVAGCKQEVAAPDPPPVVPVTVAKPLERDVVDYEDFTGRTAAPEMVEVRSRVTGYLTKIAFKDGDDVRKGAELFEIDPRPFRAEYDKALAEIKVREAQLRYQQAEVKRNEPLAAKNVVTKSDFDLIVAREGEGIAALQAAKAAAEGSALNLGFTKIHSPIAGRLGRTQVTVGNLVNADSTLLTTIVSVDPIYAYFDVDEATHLRVRKAINDGTLDLRENDEVPMFMGVANESGFPHEGHLSFVDNKVDPETGTTELRGVFPNPRPKVGQRLLEPGLFVRIRVPLGKPHSALAVAERAIGTDQGQKFVLTVNSDNKVDYRRVQLGRLDDGMREIRSGIEPSDRVIVIGVQRVQPGATVEVKEVDMASFENAPPGTSTVATRPAPANPAPAAKGDAAPRATKRSP